MKGKTKCKILKSIRKMIAQDNDIALVTSECTYQGDCTGTCPKCEAELRYLEDELRKRQNAGKAIAVAGIAATLLLGATACEPGSQTIKGDMPVSSSTSQTTEPSTEVLMGEPTVDVTEPSTNELAGVPVIDWTDPTDGLTGDIRDPFFDQEPGIDDGNWGTLH